MPALLFYGCEGRTHLLLIGRALQCRREAQPWVQAYVATMTMFVILSAFLMAASAATIQGNYSGSSNVTEYHSRGSDEPPPDLTSQQTPLDDDLTPNVKTATNESTMSSPPEPDGEITTPADGDRYDCHIENITDHVFHLCEYYCSGDEAFSLYKNETCILNYTESTSKEDNSTGIDQRKLGFCQDGKCVPQPNGTTVTPTEAATHETKTATDVTTPPPEPSTAGTTSTPGVAETTSPSTTTETSTTTGGTSRDSSSSYQNTFQVTDKGYSSS